MTIHDDLATGKRGEDIVISLFIRHGYDCEREEEIEFRSDHDLIISKEGYRKTAEVKFDVMSSQTGNIAIEFYNCRQNKPSGLEVTKADFWIHIVIKSAQQQIYIANVKELKKYVEQNKAQGSVNYAGDGNASLLLYDMDTIFNTDNELFYRIDNVSSQTFRKIIDGLN